MQNPIKLAGVPQTTGLISAAKLYNGAQMATFWRILHPAFSASRVQHVSDMHPKFALRPRHVWKYGKHPISDR